MKIEYAAPTYLRLAYFAIRMIRPAPLKSGSQEHHTERHGGEAASFFGAEVGAQRDIFIGPIGQPR